MRKIGSVAVGLFALVVSSFPTFAQSSGADLGSVKVSGYDLGPLSATGTPANSSHAVGVAVGAQTANLQGALFAVPVARLLGGSGIITGMSIKSTGGFAGSYLVRVWQKLPSATTCQDNVSFAGSDADDANLVTPPFTISMAAPSNTTGDAATYGSNLGSTWDYRNSDTTPTKNLYVCLMPLTTDTADQNKSLRVTMSGPQN